jgi:hypothetical protein
VLFSPVGLPTGRTGQAAQTRTGDLAFPRMKWPPYFARELVLQLGCYFCAVLFYTFYFFVIG